SLLDFQRALGRLVRAPAGANPADDVDFAPDERARFDRLAGSEGLRFTAEIQRSWCIGRAAKGARLTLANLPAVERQPLLDGWVNQGGGTASFFASEADAFLDFIAARLPNPSHTLTLCRLEQATLRASQSARRFAPPDMSWLNTATGALCRGRHAMLVSTPVAVLFAPGLDGLFREATDAEVELWERLSSPVALSTLLMDAGVRSIVE